MARNIYGGGANTNRFGLQFEQETSLEKSLQYAGYKIVNGVVYDKDTRLAIIGSKHNFICNILDPLDIDIRVLSKKLLPDDALFNLHNNTVYILEKKFQHCAGSVDEKLQTCDFKKKQYQRLFSPQGIEVEYCYICNDWFIHDAYEDVRNYIVSVGCHIFFNEIPIDFLGL